MSADEAVKALQKQLSELQQQQLGANAGELIYVGQYLLTRLEQLGVTVRFIIFHSTAQSS